MLKKGIETHRHGNKTPLFQPTKPSHNQLCMPSTPINEKIFRKI